MFQQRRPIKNPFPSIRSHQNRFVTGKLQIMVSRSAHDPHQWIEPVHAGHRQKQQLPKQIPASQMDAFMPQHRSHSRFAGKTFRQKKHRTEIPQNQRRRQFCVVVSPRRPGKPCRTAFRCDLLQQFFILNRSVPPQRLPPPEKIPQQLPRRAQQNPADPHAASNRKRRRPRLCSRMGGVSGCWKSASGPGNAGGCSVSFSFSAARQLAAPVLHPSAGVNTPHFGRIGAGSVFGAVQSEESRFPAEEESAAAQPAAAKLHTASERCIAGQDPSGAAKHQDRRPR